MLNVYAATWCPHCRRTLEFLKERGIEFNYIDIEQASKEVEAKIVEVNGGIDWVVPTLEFNGKWRPGKVFDASTLPDDLRKLGMNI